MVVIFGATLADLSIDHVGQAINRKCFYLELVTNITYTTDLFATRSPELRPSISTSKESSSRFTLKIGVTKKSMRGDALISSNLGQYTYLQTLALPSAQLPVHPSDAAKLNILTLRHELLLKHDWMPPVVQTIRPKS